MFMDTKVLSGVSSDIQCSSSKGTIWKLSSSSELSEHTGVLSGVWLSAELKNRHLHTGLGGVSGVMQSVVVTGLNECEESFAMEWVSQQ